MRTVVVNGRYSRYDVYIGRPSVFGNPFRESIDGTREEVIRMYRGYFHDKIADDPQFRARVLALKGRVLGCYCKPLSCHGDIIVEYLEGGKDG